VKKQEEDKNLTLILESAKKVDKILQESKEEWLSSLMQSDRD